MKNTILVILAILAISCHAPFKPPMKTGMEGAPIAAANLLLSDGTTKFNTSEIPTGQAFVLLFINPRCPYCRAEVHDILNHPSRLGNAHLYLVTSWTIEDLQAFSDEYQLDKYKNVTAVQDRHGVILERYKADAVPFTAVFDKNRRLSHAFLGIITSAQIADMIHRI